MSGNNSSMFKKILSGGAVNALSVFLLKVLGIITGILVARLFGLEGYGLYATYVTAFVLFGNTAANAIASVASREAAIVIKKSSIETVGSMYSFLLIIGIYIIMVCLLVYVLESTGVSILTNDLVSLPIFGVLVVSLILYAPIYGLINANQNYKLLFLASFFTAIFGFILLTLGYFYSGQGVLQFIYIYVTPYLILALSLYFYFARKYMKTRRDIFPRINALNVRGYSWSCILVYSSALFSPLAFWIVYSYLDDLSNGLEIVGQFFSVMQWLWVLSQLSIVLNYVIVPKLVNNQSESDAVETDFINFYIGWVAVTFVSSFLMALPEIHGFIFGDEFADEDIISALQIVLIVAVFNGFKGSISRKILALNKNWISILSNGIWFVSFLCLVFWNGVVDTKQLALFFLYSSLFSFILTLPIFIKQEVLNMRLLFTKVSLVLLLIPIAFYLLQQIDFGVLRILAVICLYIFIGYMGMIYVANFRKKREGPGYDQ